VHMVVAPFMGAAVPEASIRGAVSTPSTVEAFLTTVDSLATTVRIIITMADITATPTTTGDMATPGMEDLVSGLASVRSGDLGAIPTATDIIPRRTRTTRMALTAVLPAIPTIGTILPTLRITIATLVTRTQTIGTVVTTATRTPVTRMTSSVRQHHQT